MDVLSPGDLLARTPMPGDISRVAASLGYGYETCQSGELRFGESNFEGDLGAWVVLADAADGMHLLIFGEWGAHENFAYAGNRLLSASEAKAFG
jgi:hypothetical protein